MMPKICSCASAINGLGTFLHKCELHELNHNNYCTSLRCE